MIVRRMLHQLVDEAATTRPDGVAVVDGDRSMTYRELAAKSCRLAATLRESGVRRGDRVALYLEKSSEAVVGIYGVLRAGATYVPLDPHAPVKRLAYIALDCDVRVLITSKTKSSDWQPLVDEGAPLAVLIVLDANGGDVDQLPPPLRVIGKDEVDYHSAEAIDLESIDLDLAYILYTSGSTGEPKGVKLSHLNAMSFVEWAALEFDIGQTDRLSSHAPLHFDLSVFDLFAAAYGSATVVLVPAKTSVFPAQVAKWIATEQITVWYSVPSVLSMLAMRGGLRHGDLPSLRTVLFAGEVFPAKYLRALMQLLPHTRFVNLYGPTETNVCTWYEVASPPEDDDPIPIGKAIENVEVFAVTDDGRVAASGEIGELHVRGTTVMQGYWNDRERTALVLSQNSFAPEIGDSVYRSGDLIEQGRDGNLRFLGRRDAQIKSRGYRIELGEIEVALYAHAGVVECAVVAVPDELFTNRIKAFVALREGIDTADVVAHCKTRLPAYMVPEMWEPMETLPKTSTGKIDRAALGRRA